MGWNTTIVVMNDALDAIQADEHFGKALVAAIHQMAVRNDRVDVPALNHINAAHVVESHHADCTAIVTVGGNLGVKQYLGPGWGHHTKAGQLQLLREWAEKLGYRLSKIPTKKVPKCACCGTTKNIHRDVGSGGPYRCNSPNCVVF